MSKNIETYRILEKINSKVSEYEWKTPSDSLLDELSDKRLNESSVSNAYYLTLSNRLISIGKINKRFYFDENNYTTDENYFISIANIEREPVNEEGIRLKNLLCSYDFEIKSNNSSNEVSIREVYEKIAEQLLDFESIIDDL